MTLLKKIPYLLPLLLALILLLSFCTGRKTKSLTENTISLYKSQLDSLIQKIIELQAKEYPAEFMSLYIESLHILDILPDTSTYLDDFRWELIPKLDEVGAYEEAINQSWNYISRGELKNDIKYMNRCLIVYGRMAGLYNNIGKTDSAQIVYHMAIEKARHNLDELRITGSLNNMGMFFHDLENYDSAMVYYQMADNILRAYPGKSDFWKRFHGNVKNNLANVFEEWGEYEKVIKYQQENVYLYDSLGSKIGVINASISMANANIELGNYEGQEDLLDRMSRKLDPLDFSMKSDFNLYLWSVYFKYYRETGDLESAIEYLQKHSHLSDSLQRRKEDLISQSNSQLSTFASEHFKHQLQIKKAEHEIDKQRFRMLMWIIILIVLGAIVILTILVNNYKQRIRLQTEKAKRHNTDRLLAEEQIKAREQEKRLSDIDMENKKKDLADLAISLSLKKEWATELNQHLQIIESSKGNKRSRELIKLKNNVRSQIYVNKQTDLLRENINALSAEYYEKLRKEFLSLTKTEIKLCSFIRLKLTIAQIATLQNIDTASVVVGRYRLKKKLGLYTNQNLDEFLQSF